MRRRWEEEKAKKILSSDQTEEYWASDTSTHDDCLISTDETVRIGPHTQSEPSRIKLSLLLDISFSPGIHNFTHSYLTYWYETSCIVKNNSRK